MNHELSLKRIMDYSDIFGNDALEINLTELEAISRDFFNTFGTQPFLGLRFFEELQTRNGQDLFETLIQRCGYDNNPPGFFKAVFSMIKSRRRPVGINEIEIPVPYLYRLLESVFPGSRCYSVNTVGELEKIAFINPKDKPDLQKVMDQFPVRLSDHVIRQSLVSEGVAKQYLPFTGELDSSGRSITFDGHLKKGVLEQMYRNRVIFLLDMACPVYCRFCFRKHKSTRKEKTPSEADILAAADHVRVHTDIREILVTGGEPLMNKPNLEAALNALMTIDHVEIIRIATRSVAYYPELFLKNDKALIQYLIDKNGQFGRYGKRIEVGVHFVHPDEVSVQSLEIMSLLIQKGIQVYVQTPFLKGLNTDGETLGRLFTLLRRAGVKIYYIFTPCSPIHGTKEYWTPISKALEARTYLRENVSDRCIPKLCTATPLGKIEWHTSGFAVEKDADDNTFTWIRTPYTHSYFKGFIPDTGHMPDMRVNQEGTLDARFQVVMGDDSLILGNRPKKPGSSPFPVSDLLPEQIEFIKTFLKSDSGLSPSIRKTPSKSISRVHKTRVEISLKADEKAFGYIDQDPDITDVVLHWKAEDDPDMEKTGQIVKQLKLFSHIAGIRLCCREFTAGPELITEDLMDKLSRWCDFSIGSPFRVEFETWFLLPEDIREQHGKIAKMLIQKGVNSYANVPLIQKVNDQPKTIVEMADKLRHAAIEFHHLYVSGLDIQGKFNKHSLDSEQIIDIASEVRKACSGRQIPLYIRWTPEGEKDFGLRDLLGS